MSRHILIKIFKLEYYFDKPPGDFQLPYSDLLGRTYTRLPVIRCFGSSPSGQKICAHIYGVLPYLFIEDHTISSVSDNNELQNNLRALARRIEAVLANKSSNSYSGYHFVYDIQPLSARSIYGFRDRDSTFLKIFLTDPADIAVLGDLLLSGAVFGFPVQPFEIHIPFLLQFCADYNLQGMNYLEACACRVRDIRTRSSSSLNDSSNPLTYLFTQEGSSDLQSSAQRQTSTDVEVDISACDIINQCEVADGKDGNSGLFFLWAEESARRQALLQNGILNEASAEMPTVDGLLPLTGRPDAIPTETELDQIDEFNRFVREISPSQSETSQFPVGPGSQSSGLSQQVLNELCELAEASEDFDAPLPSSTLNASISTFLNASQSTSMVENDWVPTLHQSEVEGELGNLDDAILASARASVLTLLNGNTSNEKVDELVVSNDEERQDNDLFSSILDVSAASGSSEEKKDASGKEDLFPSFLDSILVPSSDSASTSAATTPTKPSKPRLPQLDGSDDNTGKRDRPRPRKRRLGLRLTPSHLSTPDQSLNFLLTQNEPSTRHAVDRSHLTLTSPGPSNQPNNISTPLFKPPGDDTVLFDETRDQDSSLEERFSPEATQVFEIGDESDLDASLVVRFSPEGTQNVEEEGEEISPLPCDLGDIDFDLHSSVHMTLEDPPLPPTYAEVEEELRCMESEKVQPVVESSQPEEKEPNVDFSASLSEILSQENKLYQWMMQKSSMGDRSSLLSTSCASTGNPVSRRAFLPVQENHCTLASLELLCRTRRGNKSSSMIPVQRSSHGICLANLGGYYVPDPQYDSILAASMAFTNSPTFLLVVCGPDKPTLSNQIPCDEDTSPVLLICKDESELLNWIVYLVLSFDPDILIGYDVERWSWNYTILRAARIGRVGFVKDISRLAPERLQCPVCSAAIAACSRLRPGQRLVVSETAAAAGVPTGACSCLASGAGDLRARRSAVWPCEPGRGRSDGPFACPGRLVFSLWHLLKHELSLHEYSFETVVRNVLKKDTPRFTDFQLGEWLEDPRQPTKWQALTYITSRALANLLILKKIDLIARTSEFARVFGIEFFHVLSRGSQYRVESLLLRTARRLNFLLPSPSPQQRVRQRAPQAIPLTLEPLSGLHADAPVVVLDFQSLYPSIAIAYNYCFSTAVGRLSVLKPDEIYEFGCLTHSISHETLRRIANLVTVSPNGVVFVRPEVYRGVLPGIWRALLTSRLMVKDSLKLYAQHSESLRQLLDARQLGLKLLANVIYGYTAASFSGRMPCVEVGDSIVHKGRECLERAIRLVEGEEAVGRAWEGSRVIYGDTDSLFVKLPPGVDKATAFRVGQAIADAVTASNPPPIKLKLEKVYYPCLLEAKKRYIGFAYESPDQTEAKFDAKGIETVRRDHAPFVGKILESTIRELFEAFQWEDTTPVEDVIASIEPSVRSKVQKFARDLSAGEVPLSSCLLARPYRGLEGYRLGACAPALQVVRRLKSVDANREPPLGSRVTYYLCPSATPASPLIGCVKATEEAFHCDTQPALHLAFYLDHQLLPPLRRVGEHLGWSVDAWLANLPRCCVAGGRRRQQMDETGDLPPTFRRGGGGSRRRLGAKAAGKASASLMRDFVTLRRTCLLCGSSVVGGGGGQVLLPSDGSQVCCAACLAANPRGAATKALVKSAIELQTLERQLHVCTRLCEACLSSLEDCVSRRRGRVPWTARGMPSRPSCAQACVNLGCVHRQARQRNLARLRSLQR